MDTIYIVLVFIYGLLFGSFFNVIGYRIPNEMSIVKPGSFCPKCKHKLKWYELIPVISFLILGGKCRKCRSKISYFYPAIELSTGILFALCYILFGFGFEFALGIIISSFFVIVVVSDSNYLIIPNEVTLFFSIASIGIQLIFDYKLALMSLIYGVILFFAMYLMMLIGNKALHEESLGGGDVKLMFFIGTILNVLRPITFTNMSSFTNLSNGFFELFLASCLASPFALKRYFLKKGRGIPFGPFILGALIVMYFFEFDIFKFFSIMGWR